MPERTDFRVQVGESWHRVCCVGCEAVASAILGHCLGDYYRLREPPIADDGEPRRDSGGETCIYDDPHIQREFVRFADGIAEAQLLLEGIRCAACVWLNEQVVVRLPGVMSAEINYTTHRATVRWNPDRILLSSILNAIQRVGYQAHPFNPAQLDVLDREERRVALWRLFVAGLGMMQVMMYAIPAYLAGAGDIPGDIEQLFRAASLLLTLPVMLYSAAPFFSSAARDLRLRRAGMDVPIALGLGIAFVASVASTATGDGPVYFDSIAMFVCLLLAGRYLELLARQKAARSLQHLARLVPEFAYRLTRYPESVESQRVPAADLRSADLVLVKPGDAVPADGVVIQGASKLNEALLTGESHPVDKTMGDTVVAGAVNISAAVIVRVARVGVDTMLSGIVRMIERAAGERPKVAETADRAAGLFVALVLWLAFLAAVYWVSVAPDMTLWVTVSLLVATCPCAFSLATPVALTAATGAFARRGIIPTKGHAIARLATATDIVFDKTGTLTRGAVRVLEILPQGRVPIDECLRIAASLEATSSHPIAAAILKSARDKGLFIAAADAEHTSPGEGIEASIDGRRYRIGTADFVIDLGATIRPREAPVPAMGAVWLGDETGVIAILRLDDALRPGAIEAVDRLTRRGYRLHLLTGDGSGIAEELAAKLGIGLVRAGANPGAKRDYVRALQQEGRIVAVVGDGINDAPVLAQADVSVAMGEGSRLAQLQGDAVFVSPNLVDFAWAIEHARKTLSVIRQNVVWAFAYNLVVMPLAFGGAITPWAAALGMSTSSLLVVLNALRLVDNGDAQRSAEVLATAWE